MTTYPTYISYSDLESKVTKFLATEGYRIVIDSISIFEHSDGDTLEMHCVALDTSDRLGLYLDHYTFPSGESDVQLDEEKVLKHLFTDSCTGYECLEDGINIEYNRGL